MHGAVALSAPLVASRARLGGRVTVSRAKATKAAVRTADVRSSSSSRRVMTRLRASVETTETASSEAEEAWNEDDIDNIEFAATKLSDDAAIANKDGAGATMAAPDWLTQLNRLWGGNSEIPVADAKLEDITGLLGGGLFQPLFKWMKEAGPVYLLPTGPVTSYVVVSDPDCIKQILFNYGSKYIKGTIAEAGEFLFGLGVALQENEAWKIRRKAVAPSLHRRYVEAMVDRCFGPCAERMVELVEQTVDADGGEKKRVNMESKFSQAALDIIGISVFNYDFKALTSAAPVIQATYTALKEVETRSMDLSTDLAPPRTFPPRRVPAAEERPGCGDCHPGSDHQARGRLQAHGGGRREGGRRGGMGPGLPQRLQPLRAPLSHRRERGGVVDAAPRRPALFTRRRARDHRVGAHMGHVRALKTGERRAAQALTRRARRGSRDKPFPTYEDMTKMPYLERCFHESMRLYPQPPVYTRRAVVEDVLPKNLGVVPAGQDILVSIYNLHRSPESWGPNSQVFEPMRFGPLALGQPNELNTGYRYTPFSAGPRRCPGDKFAVLEGMAIWAVLFRRLDLTLVKGHDVVMTSGATIHTRDGMLVDAKRRQGPVGEQVDWASLVPEKDIGSGWFEKGIEAKGSSGGGKCPVAH